MRHLKILALTMVGLLASSKATNAGQLDMDLLQAGPKVVKNLQLKGFQYVGVLRFQVQLPGKEPSFQVSSLNAELSNLLTHALVQGNPTSGAIITPLNDVNKRLSERRILDWSDNPKDRAKMFMTMFQPLWGSKSTTPDAFLTGNLKIQEDKATKRYTGLLEIKYFTKEEGSPIQTLMSVPVRVDGELLAETGRSLVMARKPSGKVEIADREEDVEVPEVKKVESLENLAGVQVKLLTGKINESNDLEVIGELKATPPSSQSQSVYKLGGLKADDYLLFELTNVEANKKNLTAMVRINGTNLIQVDEVTTRKFFLRPGKSVLVRGALFNTTGEKNTANQWKPLKGLNSQAAKAVSEELGDKAGFIEIEVYESSEVEITSRHPIRARSKPLAGNQFSDVMAQSFSKSMTKQQAARVPKSGIMPRDFPAVMVVPDEAKIITTPGITIRDFPNPTLRGAVTIQIDGNLYE
jgi:hypothetical protein